MRNYIFRRRYNRNLHTIVGLAGAVALAFSFLILSGCGSEKTSTSTATDTDTGGRIQIAETSYDFGSVPVNQQVEHSFEIRNAGTGVLQLGQLNVKRLEGC